MSEIAVLIPCYNEAATITKVVSDFRQFLPEATIYVYDNNSSDDTAAKAQAAGAIVRKEPRQGKGNVIRTMFDDIQADCYVMVDGDDTYPAECAHEMCRQVLEEGAHMVIGDRLSTTYYEQNTRAFHNMGNSMVRYFVNRFFAGHITDIMTGYRVFSKIFVKTFPVLSEGFEIETEMTIHALDKKLRVVSIPVEYRDRPEGSTSKLNTITDGFRVLGTIFNLYRNYRPLPFFGVIALLLALISAVLFIPNFIEFITTNFVSHTLTLIISGFVMLSAMLSFVCGLVLDTVRQSARTDFELKRKIMLELLHS
jgi:glycosyltransferase involved in cell wall biosynthesis